MIETSRFSGSNFLKADKQSEKSNHSDSDDQGGITGYRAKWERNQNQRVSRSSEKGSYRGGGGGGEAGRGWRGGRVCVAGYKTGGRVDEWMKQIRQKQLTRMIL